jgi:hypothetical protein
MPGSINVFSAHFLTSPRMFKAAADAAGETYAPTAHRSLLFPSPCTCEGVFVWTKQELWTRHCSSEYGGMSYVNDSDKALPMALASKLNIKVASTDLGEGGPCLCHP